MESRISQVGFHGKVFLVEGAEFHVAIEGAEELAVETHLVIAKPFLFFFFEVPDADFAGTTPMFDSSPACMHGLCFGFPVPIRLQVSPGCRRLLVEAP